MLGYEIGKREYIPKWAYTLFSNVLKELYNFKQSNFYNMNQQNSWEVQV